MKILRTALVILILISNFAVYSSGQGTWKSVASIPDTVRFASKALSVGGKGYVIGGTTTTSYSHFSSDLWEYDPIANTWSAKAPFPGKGKYGPAGFVFGNKLYIVCGWNGSSVSNELWEYDPVANSWTSKANFPGVARYDAAAFTIGDKAYVGSGSIATSPYLNDFYSYTPATDSWATIASLPVSNGRSGAIGFTIGDTGYVALGQSEPNPPYFNDVWAYDAVQNKWTQKASYPGDGENDSRVFVICNEVYVANGLDSINDPSKSFYLYNPAKNSWSVQPIFPGNKRWFGVAFSIGNTGYVGTGRDWSGSYNDFWAFSIPGPKADFNYSLATQCSATVNFIDHSTNNPVSWNWSFPGGIPSASTEENPTVTYPGNGNYTVKLVVTNCLGSDSSIQSITISNSLILNVKPANPSICMGSNIQLTATGANNYVWSPLNGLSSASIPNPIANPTTTTTYTVIGTLNNCIDSTNIVIVVNTIPIVTTTGPTSIICADSNVQLIANGATSYMWLPSIDFKNNLIPNPTVSPGNTTTYTVIGTSNSCNDTATIIVTVKPRPNLTASNSPPQICLGDTSKLIASGAGSYSWFPSANLDNYQISDPSATPTITTTYYVTGIQNGCSDTASIVIVVNPIPKVSVTAASFTICANSGVQLSASGATSYFWSPSNGLSNDSIYNPFATPLLTSTYTVVGITNNCRDTTSFTIKVNPSPVVTAKNPSSIVCSGNSIILSADGAMSYTWTPGNIIGNQITVNPLETTSYIVTGITDGCSDTAIFYVTVLQNGGIAIPNAFSPNGDGIDDTYRIIDPQNISLQVFSIYNRWGQEVFTTNDPDLGWDGTYNGVKEPVGVYVYYLIGKSITCGDVKMKGNVTLLR